MINFKTHKIPIIVLLCTILFLSIIVQNLPQKKPLASSDTKVYLSQLSSLNYTTKSKGIKQCFIFGTEKNNTYKVLPALYCLNLGQKASSGIPFKSITKKVKEEAAAAMRWGYQRNYITGVRNEEEKTRNSNLLKYVYKVSGYTESEFRYATQIAVWLMLNNGNLHGYETKDPKNKIFILANKIYKMAENDIGKGKEDIGPRAIKTINPSNPTPVVEGNKLKIGPYSYETSVPGYPYLISIVEEGKDKEKTDFYVNNIEYPKGFQIKSKSGTFTAATKWNMDIGDREAENKKRLEAFIKKTLKSEGKDEKGKRVPGETFTIYADADADRKEVVKIAKHVRIFVEGLQDSTKEDSYYYDTKLKDYQKFGRMVSVQSDISDGIDVNLSTGGAQLKIIKYPSDAKFSGEFTLDSTDAQAWADQNNDRLENDPQEILDQKIKEAIQNDAASLMANSEFLQAFEDYKIAVANGDTAQQETLAGKFRPLLFYAQNDTDHDEIAEVLEAYHNTLALEAQNEFDETGAVTNPLFQLIYEEYAANLDKGTAQVKIDATFVIRGTKGAFENTSYQSKVVDNGAYSYLKLKTQNGKLAITGVKQGKYVIAELSTVRDNYSTDGYQKLYTNFGGTKKIVESTKTDTLEYDGKTYTGSVVDVIESGTASLNYFDFIKINYPRGTLEVNKTAKAPVPDAEETPVDAAFRLVGITKDASHPMKSGQADDPAADGGHNFMTESGHARITKLLPGDYVLYEYRKGQSYTDKDGETYEMEDGCKEYDTNPSSDKSKMIEVYRFTVKAGKEGTSASFVAKVSNVLLPSLALIKLDGEEFDTLYKDYATNDATREELLTFFSDREGFQTEIDASFLLTGVSPGASYPDGKLFDTMQNVCLITDLEPGTYEVQEQGIISANQDQYEVNRKTYEIELTAQYTKENPYLIVHPNYKDRPIFADLVLNKIDNMAFSVSDVTISCAAYIGEYTEGYYDNKLSQKNNENKYMGKEFYAEGTVKNGLVSFENIKVDVDEDNYVTTWLHLHEIAGKAGYDSVPVDFEGNTWNDYAEQCPYCKITGVENANGYDLSLHDIKAYPVAKGRKTINIINNRIEKDTAYLAIHKTTPAGLIDIEGAEFELYTDPEFGTPQKIPTGYIQDAETGEEILTTLELDDTSTTQTNILTNEKGQARLKITKSWLDQTERFLVKEIFVPEPYLITQAETSFQLSIGDTKALSIENDIKEGESGKIVIKKVALNEEKTPLEGAVFLLYEAKQDADGNWVKEEDAAALTGMSDATGSIVFPNLVLGKRYIAEEKQAPDGYEISETSRNIILVAVPDSDDTTVEEVINAPEQVQVEVTKKDVETKEALAGAQFFLRDEKDQIIAILKTDENGYAISKKLEKWDATKRHTIEEGVAPAGYELLENGGKQTIILEEGKTLYHFDYEDESTKGTVKIHKSSTNPESLIQFPLTGTRFELRAFGREEVVDTLVIKEDGYSQTSKPLPLVKYTITEVAVSDGYYLDKDGDHIPDSIGFSKTIELKTNETVTIECINQPVSGKLEIHKVDSKDGKKAVGGVIFDLYRDDGSEHGILIETLETDENGIAFSSSLYQGNYFYIEKKAPPNYWVDATPHPFVINQTNMGVIQSVITNDLVELNIRVHKMDDKKRNLAGVGFTLFDKDGNALTFTQIVDEVGNTQEVSEFFTDEDGMLIFPQKVGYGKYTLKETTTPPKYKKADDITITIDSNTKYVEIEAIGKTVTCEVINYPKIASIKIVKKDKDTALPLSGVEFLVTCEENNYAQKFVTNAEGEIMITNLEAGTYSFTETKPKDGYLGTTPDGKPITGTIEVTEDGKEYQVIVDNQKPDVKPGTCKVRKIDKESKVPLMGAIFYAKDEKGNLISSQTSDADGYAVFEGLMPENTYVIEEMRPPAGYELATPSKVEITIKEGETKEILFENAKIVEEKGSLILMKKGEDGTLLAGAIFRISNEEIGYQVEKETGADGKIQLTDLAFGEYKIVEIAPPSGYQLSKNPVQTVLLVKGEKEITVTYINEKIPEPENPGEMWITKVDAETDKTLAGVIFRVLNAKKEEVMRAVTDSDGKIIFTLEEGDYYYQEVKAPDGYQLDEELHPFTIKKGESVQVTVKNKKMSGKFVMNKIDSFSGVPIPDCTFVILDQYQKEILRGVTDKNGICEFTLPAGIYYYQELKAAPDYILDGKPYRFEITKDNQIIHETMTNVKEKEAEIIILKLDEKTKEPLSGCKFRLQKADGTKVQEKVTNEEGFCSFKVELGEYQYQEIEAPSGYQLDSKVYTVTISLSGQREQIIMYNQKIPQPSKTPEPTETPKPTEKPKPTETPKPTGIPNLPDTPKPSVTPNPPEIPIFPETPNPPEIEPERPELSPEQPEMEAEDETELSPEQPETTPMEPELAPEQPDSSEQPDSPKLTLIKVDFETQERISGCIFAIYDEQGNKLSEGKTDKNGLYSVSLPAGTYAYQEIAAAPGYMLDDTRRTITVSDQEDTQYTITNAKKTIWLPKTGDKLKEGERQPDKPIQRILVTSLFAGTFLTAASTVVYFVLKNKKRKR